MDVCRTQSERTRLSLHWVLHYLVWKSSAITSKIYPALFASQKDSFHFSPFSIKGLNDTGAVCAWQVSDIRVPPQSLKWYGSYRGKLIGPLRGESQRRGAARSWWQLGEWCRKRRPSLPAELQSKQPVLIKIAHLLRVGTPARWNGSVKLRYMQSYQRVMEGGADSLTSLIKQHKRLWSQAVTTLVIIGNM